MTLDAKLSAYTMKFNDGFPMMPLGWGRSDDEIIEIIDRCLTEGKDVYELGYLEDDNDIEY